MAALAGRPAAPRVEQVSNHPIMPSQRNLDLIIICSGTKATFDLYGTTWAMYQGINYNIGSGSGVELTTILPASDFGATGSWSGDIKDWLEALVTQGVFTEDYYVTNANAGTEQYWGDSVLVSTVGLEINLN